MIILYFLIVVAIIAGICFGVESVLNYIDNKKSQKENSTSKSTINLDALCRHLNLLHIPEYLSRWASTCAKNRPVRKTLRTKDKRLFSAEKKSILNRKRHISLKNGLNMLHGRPSILEYESQLLDEYMRAMQTYETKSCLRHRLSRKMPNLKWKDVSLILDAMGDPNILVCGSPLEGWPFIDDSSHIQDDGIEVIRSNNSNVIIDIK